MYSYFLTGIILQLINIYEEITFSLYIFSELKDLIRGRYSLLEHVGPQDQLLTNLWVLQETYGSFTYKCE